MLDTFEFPQGTSGISENILKKTFWGFLSNHQTPQQTITLCLDI